MTNVVEQKQKHGRFKPTDSSSSSSSKYDTQPNPTLKITHSSGMLLPEHSEAKVSTHSPEMLASDTLCRQLHTVPM